MAAEAKEAGVAPAKKAAAPKKKKPAGHRPAGGFQTHQVTLTTTRGALPVIREAFNREADRLLKEAQDLSGTARERAVDDIRTLRNLALDTLKFG